MNANVRSNQMKANALNANARIFKMNANARLGDERDRELNILLTLIHYADGHNQRIGAFFWYCMNFAIGLSPIICCRSSKE